MVPGGIYHNITSDLFQIYSTTTTSGATRTFVITTN